MASSDHGRKAINLEPYRDEIISLYSTSTSVDSIRIKRTLENRLQQWEIRRQDRTIASNPLLHARIRVLFFQVGLEDKELLSVLQKEGFSIFSRTLRRLRTQLGLFRRVRDPLAQQLQREEMLKALELLHRHIRSKGYIIRRNRLFSAYKTVLPDAVHRRKYDLQRKRGEFVVPRPNFIWSVDGYLKLEPYGIEIYAAIDAYSRYIIWIYCGITARTAVSVLRQYLETIDNVQLLPSRVRSDQGLEIVLFRSAYLQLCRVREPNIQLNSCWISGRSTENQRIEACYFKFLSEDGLFSKASLADQIALYAMYTPILRTKVCHFVQAWNCHRIRRQPDRPNLIGADEATPFRTTYLQLRHILITHIKRQIQLFLALSTRPIGAFNWEPEVA
ncbi:hypothetical protein BJX96DRAFT_170107 [Aspergillus floccosus]